MKAYYFYCCIVDFTLFWWVKLLYYHDLNVYSFLQALNVSYLLLLLLVSCQDRNVPVCVPCVLGWCRFVCSYGIILKSLVVVHEGIFQGQVWSNLFVEKAWSLFFKIYTMVFWNTSKSGVHSACVQTFSVWAVGAQCSLVYSKHRNTCSKTISSVFSKKISIES